jgi:anti-anti-sigma factor
MLEITRENQGALVILSIAGQLDATTAPELDAALMSASDAGSRYMLLNCTRLTYVSSAGLRILLKVYKQLKPTNGMLALTALQPHIREIFELTGFTNLFSIHDSREAAIRALTPPTNLLP